MPATLLIDVDAATRLAPKVREYYPDSVAAVVGYLIGNWQLVIIAYAGLAATVAASGEEYAA